MGIRRHGRADRARGASRANHPAQADLKFPTSIRNQRFAGGRGARAGESPVAAFAEKYSSLIQHKSMARRPVRLTRTYGLDRPSRFPIGEGRFRQPSRLSRRARVVVPASRVLHRGRHDRAHPEAVDYALPRTKHAQERLLPGRCGSGLRARGLLVHDRADLRGHLPQGRRASGRQSRSSSSRRRPTSSRSSIPAASSAPDLAFARFFLSLAFGIGIGLLMALIFRSEDAAHDRATDALFAGAGRERHEPCGARLPRGMGGPAARRDAQARLPHRRALLRARPARRRGRPAGATGRAGALRRSEGRRRRLGARRSP